MYALIVTDYDGSLVKYATGPNKSDLENQGRGLGLRYFVIKEF